jgi:hypothetical protein
MNNDLYVLVDHSQKMIIDHIRKLPENWNNISGLNLLDDKKLSNLDWAEQTNLGWIKINNKSIKDYTYLPEWFDLNKLDLKKMIAVTRWEKEQDIISFKGNRLKLNDRTRLSLSLQKIDNDISIIWKFIDGFVPLTSIEFTEMYNFVIQYIQGCFAEEQRLIGLYDLADNLQDLLKLKIVENWPSSVYE